MPSRVWSIGFAACMSLLFVAASAPAQSGGQQVCLGDYVLCDAAACESEGTYSDGDSIDCYCRKPGPGLNIANSACALRENTSTYSLSNIDPAVGTPAKAWGCTASELLANGKGWTFCLDAPCHEDPSHEGGWTCSCKYMDPNENPSTMYTFGIPEGSEPGGCARDCDVNWSGATWSELLTGYSSLAVMNPDFIKLDFCGPPSP